MGFGVVDKVWLYPGPATAATPSISTPIIPIIPTPGVAHLIPPEVRSVKFMFRPSLASRSLSAPISSPQLAAASSSDVQSPPVTNAATENENEDEDEGSPGCPYEDRSQQQSDDDPLARNCRSHRCSHRCRCRSSRSRSRSRRCVHVDKGSRDQAGRQDGLARDDDDDDDAGDDDDDDGDDHTHDWSRDLFSLHRVGMSCTLVTWVTGASAMAMEQEGEEDVAKRLGRMLRNTGLLRVVAEDALPPRPRPRLRLGLDQDKLKQKQKEKDQGQEKEQEEEDVPTTAASGGGGGGVPTTAGVQVQISRTMWGSDPLFRGSYSYVKLGSSGEDIDRIAESLPSQQPQPQSQSQLQLQQPPQR